MEPHQETLRELRFSTKLKKWTALSHIEYNLMKNSEKGAGLAQSTEPWTPNL